MTGTVFDIGYRNYTGAREGRHRARLAVFKDGVRIALGLGRGGRAKILPWFFIALLSIIGLVMAIVVGAAVRLAGPEAAAQLQLPEHSDYYAGVAVIIFVFAAIVAPELLCRDRREGTINLYLVRPLTGTDYLLARWAAFLTVMLGAIWLPQIVFFLGLCGGAPDPGGYFQQHWLDIPKFLGAGIVMAMYATTLAMLTAAFTTRRAYASVLLVGLVIITTPFTAGLAGEIGGTVGGWLSLFNIAYIPAYAGDVIFGAPGELTKEAPAHQFTSASLFGWWALWVAVPGAILWMRYRRLTP